MKALKFTSEKKHPLSGKNVQQIFELRSPKLSAAAVLAVHGASFVKANDIVNNFTAPRHPSGLDIAKGRQNLIEMPICAMIGEMLENQARRVIAKPSKSLPAH